MAYLIPRIHRIDIHRNTVYIPVHMKKYYSFLLVIYGALWGICGLIYYYLVFIWPRYIDDYCTSLPEWSTSCDPYPTDWVLGILLWCIPALAIISSLLSYIVLRSPSEKKIKQRFTSRFITTLLASTASSLLLAFMSIFFIDETAAETGTVFIFILSCITLICMIISQFLYSMSILRLNHKNINTSALFISGTLFSTIVVITTALGTLPSLFPYVIWIALCALPNALLSRSIERVHIPE